jgi:exopolysaccharide biosynthesis polyprenyl glycosylphosphotransferase
MELNAASFVHEVANAPEQRAKPAQLSPLALMVAAQPIIDAKSPIVVAGIVRITEFLLISVIGVIAYFAYVYPQFGVFDFYYVGTTLGVAALAVLAFQVVDIYHLHAFRRPANQCAKLTVAWSVVFLSLVTVMFFARLGDLYSRVWLAGFFGLGLLALYAYRVMLYRKVRRWSREGRLDRRAVLVGGGETGETLVKELAAQEDSEVRLLGVFDDRGDDRAPNFCGGLPKLGSVDDLVEFARRTRVDLVLFSLPISAEARILQMLKKLWVLPVDIRLSAHTNQLRFRPRSYSYIGKVPVLDVFDRPIADWDVVMKSLFDRVVGAFALLALSPLMLLAALAIKLDSRGPVLFRQKRYGFNNELIEVFKFRSMYVEATDATAAKLVTKGDPRVTRVGRFIRKTSIDELPQLFNVVFKGNLSLVENWSVLFDLYILAMTPISLLKSENAY